MYSRHEFGKQLVNNSLLFVSVDKPGKPEELIIKGATSSAVTLAWQAPADDGGAPVTNYVVEYRKEGVNLNVVDTMNKVPFLYF